MDLQDIVLVIPQLFSYFIPGYIALMISNKYRQEGDIDEKHLVVKSIIYSFVTEIGLLFVIYIFRIDYWLILRKSLNVFQAFKNLYTFVDKSNIWYIGGLLAMSLIIGVFLVRYSNSKLERIITKNIYNSNLESYSSVWNFVMRQERSKWAAWARVYLKDENVYYIGHLKKYSTDAGQGKRELYLQSYILYNLETEEKLEDCSGMTNVGVWINADSVNRIEIFPENSTTEPEENKIKIKFKFNYRGILGVHQTGARSKLMGEGQVYKRRYQNGCK